MPNRYLWSKCPLLPLVVLVLFCFWLLTSCQKELFWCKVLLFILKRYTEKFLAFSLLGHILIDYCSYNFTFFRWKVNLVNRQMIEFTIPDACTFTSAFCLIRYNFKHGVFIKIALTWIQHSCYKEIGKETIINQKENCIYCT